MVYDVLIIGGGVIGAMLARELMRYRVSVLVLEKENDVSCGASKANSGIIHGGYDPEPNTNKARFNVQGIEKLYRAAQELNVPHQKCGAFVCAFGKEEEAALAALQERGKRNGAPETQILSGEEARCLEPNLSQEVTAVLSVPASGIISPYELTLAAMGNAMDHGARLMRNFTVCQIEKREGLFFVKSAEGEEACGRFLANCAGGFSGEVSAMAGDPSLKILPRRGEYLLLDATEGKRVSRTVFQVPGKEGKGILVSPTAEGNLLLGPTAESVSSPEDRETTSDGLKKVELLAKKSVPSVNLSAVITSFCGVRATGESGDFVVEESRFVKGLLQLAAIESPGLTASVAIGEYGVKLLGEMGLKLEPNPDFQPIRPNLRCFRELSTEEKNKKIKEDPSFGKIVCRCEGISEGEIREILFQNPVPLDMDGVKRRTRAGMGRCQGGFCSVAVAHLFAESRGLSVKEITKKGKGSRWITGAREE